MDDLDMCRRGVEAGAGRGAASVSRDRQLQADAIERAVRCWEDAVLRQRTVSDWEAWAFRVAANAAKRLGRQRSSRLEVEPHHDPMLERFPGTQQRIIAEEARAAPGDTRAGILARRHLLIGRQLEVLLCLAEPGMSLHRAARELAMDRTALRRSFRSGLARLRSD